MAQQVKALITKAKTPAFHPQTHMVEENLLRSLSLSDTQISVVKLKHFQCKTISLGRKTWSPTFKVRSL